MHREMVSKTIIAPVSGVGTPLTRWIGLRAALVAFVLGLGVAVLALESSAASGFHELGVLRGPGFINRALVAPSAVKGKEKLYLVYANSASSLHLVEVDPDTGQHKVFVSPLASQTGAWGMALGGDGSLYLGTYPNAHLLRFDPGNGSFTDLGKPVPNAQFIWQLVRGSDGKLYGGTYPQARLFRFDPASQRVEDLGRMDPAQRYARTVAASADGFIYVGIGPEKAKLIAYEIATAQRKEILPEQFQGTGFAMVQKGDDGEIYVRAPGNKTFRVKGWTVTDVGNQAVKDEVSTRLQDGRIVDVVGGKVRVQNPKDKSSHELAFQYGGAEQDVARLGFGPDGMLYASTKMPLRLLQIDPRSGRITDLGELGGGEVYSFLATKTRLLAAAYAARAPLVSYDPGKPFAPGSAPTSNPALVTFKNQNNAWRPVAMIQGPGSLIFVGARGGYGEKGGTLTSWDTANQSVEVFRDVVRDQSVSSLAEWRGMIVGGTSLRGGEGARAALAEAKLFIWDPKAKKTVFEAVVMPRAANITNVLRTRESRIFGIADNKEFFIFDPATRKVLYQAVLPFSMPGRFNDNNTGLDADGNIWGITAEGVFRIAAVTRHAELVARSPAPITGGFAMRGASIYFASGAKIFHYDMK